MGTVHVAFGTLEILGPGIARFVDMSVRDVTKEGLLLVFVFSVSQDTEGVPHPGGQSGDKQTYLRPLLGPKSTLCLVHPLESEPGRAPETLTSHHN